MARIQVHPSGLRVSAGQLAAVERELGGLRAALGRLEGAAEAGWSGDLTAGTVAIEHGWAASVGAMELGAASGAHCVSATAVAYEQVDQHVMPAATGFGP